MRRGRRENPSTPILKIALHQVPTSHQPHRRGQRRASENPKRTKSTKQRHAHILSTWKERPAMFSPKSPRESRHILSPNLVHLPTAVQKLGCNALWHGLLSSIRGAMSIVLVLSRHGTRQVLVKVPRQFPGSDLCKSGSCSFSVLLLVELLTLGTLCLPSPWAPFSNSLAFS